MRRHLCVNGNIKTIWGMAKKDARATIIVGTVSVLQESKFTRQLLDEACLRGPGPPGKGHVKPHRARQHVVPPGGTQNEVVTGAPRRPSLGACDYDGAIPRIQGPRTKAPCSPSRGSGCPPAGRPIRRWPPHWCDIRRAPGAPPLSNRRHGVRGGDVENAAIERFRAP